MNEKSIMNEKSEKRLIIAEKPSVAKDIVKVLDRDETFSDKGGYFEGEDNIVTFALGHLLTIAEPHEISEKFKTWSLKNLPIIPDHFLLKPITNNQKQLNVISKLIKRKDVNHVVNACDSGREGELIFRYIIDYVLPKQSKKLSRLWLQSMTKESIRESFKHLRSNEELYHLKDAAISRSEADWLVGINASRGLTSYNSKFGGFILTPCGRVQTPTLSLMVTREKEIEAFIPQDYWVLIAQFNNAGNAYQGEWFDPQFKAKAKEVKDAKESKQLRANRIFDQHKADAIIEKCTGKNAKVEDKSRESIEKCQMLYDLTSLQREANSLFGYSAKKTLSIIQTLYEKYKLLTYPRTDSRYLPEDYLDTVHGVFDKFSKLNLNKNLSRYMEQALKNNYLTKNPRVYNNKKISDHHAIIPTGEIPKKLEESNEKIFYLVLQRFIAVFYPEAKYLKTTRISEVCGELFKTEGKVMLDLGWKVVYGKNENDKVINAIDSKNVTTTNEVIKEEMVTRPPSRYTEASLLSAMESAGKMIEDELLKEAMKERGLGTPATRAAIIEKLVADRYVVKQDRELLPTAKAYNLFELIFAMKLNGISSPELTGEWEHKLTLIEKGQLGREEFMQGIIKSTTQLVEMIKNFDEDSLKREADFSPINGMKFYKYLTRYLSEDGKIMIKKVVGGKRLKEEQVVTLLTERKLGPFEDFRSKRGNLFPASLILDENDKVKFIFMNQKEEAPIDLKDAIEIGVLYSDKSPVYQTMNNYVSESFIEKKDSGVKVNRILLGKEISKENILKMINGEKSDLIIGFRSTRTKRFFDAYLEFDNQGKVKFSFPEKKGKAAKNVIQKKSDQSPKVLDKKETKKKESKKTITKKKTTTKKTATKKTITKKK